MPDIEFFHHKLFRRVIYFEWAILIVCIVGELILWRFAPFDLSSPNLLLSVFFLILVSVFSFFTPVEHGYWDRMCFLFMETILLTGATAAGSARLVFPLFTVVIAKACLVLDRRGLVATGMAAFAAQLVWSSYKIMITMPMLHSGRLPTMIGVAVTSFILTYVGIVVMILVAMLTLALVSEQQSRMEAERLSREVEDLARELERSRIAREIHDSLGHSLTTLNVQLDLARKFSKDNPLRAAEALALAKQLASQALDDVRLAVQSIRQPDFDLKAALNSLIKEASDNISVNVKLPDNVDDLPVATSFQIYRIIQECLTNVRKHAQASEARIELAHDGRTVSLSVSDNGQGLPRDSHDGYGIKGMQERVETMHGNIAIETEPHQGTRIQVSIPL